MKKSIKKDGIKDFIIDEFSDEKYHPNHATAWERWIELLEMKPRWPWAELGRQFNRSREQIRTWIKAMVQEGLWDERRFGPASIDPNSGT